MRLLKIAEQSLAWYSVAGIFREQASAFVLAKVMTSGFEMVSAIGKRIQCRKDMIVF